MPFQRSASGKSWPTEKHKVLVGQTTANSSPVGGAGALGLGTTAHTGVAYAGSAGPATKATATATVAIPRVLTTSSLTVSTRLRNEIRVNSQRFERSGD